ncbi:glycerophosphodiester phosphodiesterase family protein [Aminipila sp.]|uniref:glycerophosphodiester phosphodiesterase family protein n=1 Tax=Aminipila sp. TaxID=2060095 RepID=UPI00289A64B2|nr:glycerophosphodiester phosphodiesterase family protein [Aminipila sp.]
MGIFLLLLILSIIYLLLVMPCLDRRKEISDYLNCFYAHRGLHDNNNGIPENSLVAFEKAILYGYGIELDVQLTKDNVAIVIHDDNLIRVCGINKKVSETTYDEISKLKLLNSNIGIPKLTDVLNLVEGKVPLIVELKTADDIKNNCRIIANILDGYSGRYCVESFNPFIMQWFKRYRKKVLRGQLSTNYFKEKVDQNFLNKFMLSHFLLNFISRPDFIAFNIKYKNMLSLKINKWLLNTPLFAWTVRSHEQLEEIKNFFDSFIFEQFIPKETVNRK